MKTDDVLLTEHKFWLESFAQMGLAEPLMMQNVVPGQGAILWMTRALDTDAQRIAAYRRISRGLAAHADQLEAAMRGPAPNGDEDMRFVTTQGPPLPQELRQAMVPPSAIAPLVRPTPEDDMPATSASLAGKRNMQVGMSAGR